MPLFTGIEQLSSKNKSYLHPRGDSGDIFAGAYVWRSHPCPVMKVQPPLRRVDEFADERNGVLRLFFHQPMAGAENDFLLHVGGYFAHDLRL